MKRFLISTALLGLFSVTGCQSDRLPAIEAELESDLVHFLDVVQTEPVEAWKPWVHGIDSWRPLQKEVDQIQLQILYLRKLPEAEYELYRDLASRLNYVDASVVVLRTLLDEVEIATLPIEHPDTLVAVWNLTALHRFFAPLLQDPQREWAVSGWQAAEKDQVHVFLRSASGLAAEMVWKKLDHGWGIIEVHAREGWSLSEPEDSAQ